MTVSHDPAVAHAIEYVLQCRACGNLIDCSASTDREACDDIDAFLDSRYELRCAACRAMPNSSPGHLDPAA